MPGTDTPPTYRILDAGTVPALVGSLPAIRAQLGGRPESWQVHEVGDGNLNLVFIVRGANGSVCVKQALPYVRVAGASWPMTLERAYFEASYYSAVAPWVDGLIPRIHHYDPELYCTVMECLRLEPRLHSKKLRRMPARASSARTLRPRARRVEPV